MSLLGFTGGATTPEAPADEAELALVGVTIRTPKGRPPEVDVRFRVTVGAGKARRTVGYSASAVGIREDA